MSEQRRAELAESLAEVRARIGAACADAGRDPGEVRLLAVTKTFPASDAALLAELGITDLAENRDQEAAVKARELSELPIRWHMVGRMQRNKARSVARWASEVQSVDSPRLAEALAKAVRAALDAGDRAQPMDVLVQASLDDPQTDAEGRGGCPLDELAALTEVVAHSSELRLRGLMAVAPLGADPAPAFARLAEAAERTRRDHPEATELSAGMSGDLDVAIHHGSTCVRVGTALLGGRGLASL
ncbi:YggS family pyridoxal phosphate-dependent enzyme [Amycolatopsis sp. CA-230715]|uniref:YggS family pyridoxal phosphate-dependent enzyme n=1 Tax=Amycolatopsis sp. CA-230715 TaxID=2745196 RepID=UPI001C033792|nr:YggS family pyridoxal phosphate-dependent enzyme [Amycolatopsis sp. CA-230715]QWF77002.1 Pyridoxal phosphate homeostasis protein [Amycolatopsis sp. CA-230715]